jgi:hypothetical protein
MAEDKGPPFERFRPFTRRQRLLIVALAVGTTISIGVAMLTPHVAYLRARLALKWADVPPCAAGQTEGCTGGTMGVIVVAPPASAPR